MITAAPSAQTSAPAEGRSPAGQLSPAAQPPVQLLVSSNLSSDNPTPRGLHISCHAQSTTVIETISISILMSARLCTARREIYAHSFLKCCNAKNAALDNTHLQTNSQERMKRVFFNFIEIPCVQSYFCLAIYQNYYWRI